MRASRWLVLSLAFTACDVPSNQEASKLNDGPCTGPQQQVTCGVIEGQVGAPQQLVLEFEGSGTYCAEVEQENGKPNRVAAAWLTLDGEQELLSPSSFNQNVDVVSTEFEAGPGAHELTFERAGTKHGSTSVCVYSQPDPDAIIALSPESGGSFSDPETGFEIEWPEGAVGVDTVIWCEGNDDGAVVCGPDGTTFEKPVIVSFPYAKDEALMTEGLAPVVERDGEALLTTRVPSHGRVYAATSHFSLFRVAYRRPAKISNHFGYFDVNGGDITTQHLGAVKPLLAGEVGIIALTKEVGHRYTITTSSPPEKAAVADNCSENSFPAGNVDVHGYWRDPELFASPNAFRIAAAQNGWASTNTPGFVPVVFKGFFNDEQCVRGTEDAFSVGPVVSEEPYYILVTGVSNQSNYHTVRIVDADMFATLGVGGKLTWPLDSDFKPTDYGQYNTTWGNPTYTPYYLGDGYEINGGARYMIHDGVDVEADKGTPVKAVCTGTIVRKANLDDSQQGYNWGDYLMQRCDLGMGKVIHVAYDHIDVKLFIGVGDEVEVGQELGNVVALGLPGEPAHLHLGICVGTYDEGNAAGTCEPYKGASRDKWFPYVRQAKKDVQGWVNINPDICTKPKFCAMPAPTTPKSAQLFAQLCDQPSIWKAVENLNCN